MARVIFIGGIDTSTGKTLTCCALSQYFAQQHLPVKYLKPFQTGPRPDWDGHTLKRYGSVSGLAYFWTHQHPGSPYECTTFFQAPPIQWLQLQTWLEQEGMCAPEPIVLIEGCGGLQVPITQDHTLLDLVRIYPPIEIILVSHLQLGTLHHTAQSIQILRTMPNKFLGIIFFGTGNTRNISMIETLYQTTTLGRVELKDNHPWFEGRL